MHQILQIESKNCIFSASEGKFPLRHLHFSNGQKFMMPNKGIKTIEVGGIDMNIANILLKMNNGFHLIFQLLKGELPLRSFWEGTPSQTPAFNIFKDL